MCGCTNLCTGMRAAGIAGASAALNEIINRVPMLYYITTYTAGVYEQEISARISLMLHTIEDPQTRSHEFGSGLEYDRFVG